MFKAFAKMSPLNPNSKWVINAYSEHKTMMVSKDMNMENLLMSLPSATLLKNASNIPLKAKNGIYTMYCGNISKIPVLAHLDAFPPSNIRRKYAALEYPAIPINKDKFK